MNAFVLTGTEEQHREKLGKIAGVARRRKVSVCAQAIVRIHDTYDEDLGRMNRFIEMARQILP